MKFFSLGFLSSLLLPLTALAQVQQHINLPTVPTNATAVANNPAAGDPPYLFMQKTEANFSSLFGRPQISNGIDINNSNPTLGQTYGDGTLVAVETIGNVAGPSFHVGNNFLTTDNGGQFSYGATSIYGQMNFGGATVTGGRTAGTFNTVMSAKTGNSAGSENYAGFDGYCTASANDNGTGLTSTTAYGSCFGGNFITTLKSGATDWQGNIGVEVDNEVDTGASVVVNVGVQAVKLSNSRVYGSVEDAAFVVGAQTGSVGWKYGIALSNDSTVGAFPVTSTGTLIGSYQTGTVGYGLDIHNITCSTYCLYTNGFTVDGSGNAAAASITTPTVNSTASSLSLEVGGLVVQGYTTTNGGQVKTAPLVTSGTAFTASNSCGGSDTVGAAGPAGGYFTQTVGGTNCQHTITIGGASPVTAPHGWYCSGEDFTSKVNAVQYTQTSTTCVLQLPGTSSANDIVLFGVVTGY